MSANDATKITSYQSLIQMLNAQSSVTWSTFSALVAANSFLIAAFALAIKNEHVNQIFLSALGVAGLVICLIWFFIFYRQFAYFGYYINFAREAQTELLDERDRFFELGAAFGEGASVRIHGRYTVRMRWSARIFKVEPLAKAIIVVFCLLYAGLLLATWFGVLV